MTMNFLEQIMNMIGIGSTTNVSLPANNPTLTNKGQDFEVNASQMPRYSTDLQTGTSHLPSADQGCFICVATKNIFSSLLGGIR
jgi:hypothetical protein